MPQSLAVSKSSLALQLTLLSVLGLIFACGIWLQTQVHLNHDVAWITHSAGWLLEGRHFGRDIIDVNPPLIWFVSLPAAWLVKMGLCTDAEAIRWYVWSLCAVSLAICHRLTRPLHETGGHTDSAALLLGAAFAMVVLPGASFAQREHLAFVLGLPYCLLIALRMDASASPSRGIAIVCGVLAAIAFGFKPWLLAVPLLLELLHLARKRTLRSVWRAETVALAAGLVIYLLAIVVFARDYLTHVVPMAMATYWAYDISGSPWFYWQAAALPVAGALVCLGIARRFPAQALALTAAFAGFSLSYWAQNKGFVYHAYPALAVAFTLFVYSAPMAARAMLRVKWPIASWLKPAMATCVVLAALNLIRIWSAPVDYWVAKYDTQTGGIGVFRSILIDRINARVPRGEYVYAFSSHPFPAFPTMSYTAAEWGSPLVAQFAVPAFVARDEVKDPARLAALDRAVQAQREQVVADFTRHTPTMVLVDTNRNRLGMHGRQFDDIAFYSADPRFAAIWGQYVETEPMGTLRIFERRSSAGLEHVVAAKQIKHD